MAGAIAEMTGTAPSGAPDPLAGYGAGSGRSDVFTAAAPEVAAAWHAFARGLSAVGGGNIGGVQAFVDRHVDDLGVAFRMTGDENERPWPLAPMPIILGADEWSRIEEGLVQRAELLEALVADIYGEQRMTREGHLPAAMISGSANFARRMVGTRPTGGHFLHVYSVDLARGPDGQWRVLADRVRLPVGIGYAIENRLAIARTTGNLLAGIGVQRHADFFEALREGIAAACQRSDPRIALLTPGRFNQSYPEQAHLVRYLGFELVEGRDLVVRDEKLFVRTIAGLKRIDALWRWINARDIDPLNFDARSQLGVPNLLASCEAGQLALANWLGSGVVESLAMSAFLPRIAKVMLGEPLKLPNVATWWCGQEKERAHVLAHFDKLVISPAFRAAVPGLPDGRTRPGSSFAGEERAALEAAIARRPMDYAAQEIVRLSTLPCLAGDHIEPRAFTLRAFLTRNGSGQWQAMPGGFGRVSEGGDLRTMLMGLGDRSCDVCVVEPQRIAQSVAPVTLASPLVRREHGLLPSQAADNLFWLGRYAERTHQTARAVRTLIDVANSAGGQPGQGTALERLGNLLHGFGAVPAARSGIAAQDLAMTAFADTAQPGSIAALTRAQRQIALLLRDRLSRDGWRVVHRALPRVRGGDAEALRSATDTLIERFAAFARLTADTMSRTAAWRFLDLGISLERGSFMVQAALALVPGRASAEDLAALLDLADGTEAYRSRYLIMPFIAPVLDMVLLDPVQPRSLAFQAARIVHHLETMPVLRTDGMTEPPLRLARQLRADVERLDAETLDHASVARLGERIGALSDAIGRRFFLQDETPGTGDAAKLLA
jgi:uncharacterized circularly permuted ATP-grasp superfamily protein/uncharacterized alpha-E superfamily protein